MDPVRQDPPHDEGPPPILRRWRNVYAVVLGGLGLWILLMWLFERTYR